MKPARFSYEAPTSIADALAALAARGAEAKIIAGGQSLAPMMNMRIAQPGHLIDINRVSGLGEIRLEGDHLVCGALMRHADLARHVLAWTHAPMLAYAASTVGHYAIRQRGTLGGSLAHADPAAQLPLAAVTLDARIEIASQGGRRLVAARDFFASIFTTVLEPHELIVAVHIPVARPHEGWGFHLFTRRAGDFALALVACTLRRTDARIDGVRLAVGGVAPTPVRLDAAVKKGAGDLAWISGAARAVAAAAPIEAHERLSAEYRRELIETLAQHALADAVESAT
ncbi:MAG: FAD binding domain-containing protein [Alphaproteobacteria bacterium]|nr:FAD binding domain-containing protein [Alphaproteobacteria bacterium]